VDVFRSMAESHELRLRMWVMLRTRTSNLRPTSTATAPSGQAELSHHPRHQTADGRRTGVARSVAAAPYSDQPESRGLNTEEPADIRQTAELALQHGYQLCIHAIGDRANREVLDIYEQVFASIPRRRTCAGGWSTRST